MIFLFYFLMADASLQALLYSVRLMLPILLPYTVTRPGHCTASINHLFSQHPINYFVKAICLGFEFGNKPMFYFNFNTLFLNWCDGEISVTNEFPKQGWNFQMCKSKTKLGFHCFQTRFPIKNLWLEVLRFWGGAFLNFVKRTKVLSGRVKEATLLSTYIGI